MKTVACYSIKGGVGKTAAAVNLAYCSAALGKQTLLIDLDPQGAASFYFRIGLPKNRKPAAFFSSTAKLLKNVRGSDYANLDVLPASLGLRKIDLVLHSLKKPGNQLRGLLASLKGEYDLVVLDCPPGLSLMSENVFRAADLVLVPVIPTMLSERTLLQLHEFFREEKYQESNIRPFFSMVQTNNKIHRETMLRLQGEHPEFLRNIIPLSADIERMGENRQPVLLDKTSRRGAVAYRLFWQEVCDLLLR